MITVYLLTFSDNRKYVGLTLDQAQWEMIKNICYNNSPASDFVRQQRDAGTIEVDICYQGTSYAKARTIKSNYIAYYNTLDRRYGLNTYDVCRRPDEKDFYIYCPQLDRYYLSMAEAGRDTGYSRQRIYQLINTTHRTKQGYSFETIPICDIPDTYFSEV